MQTERESEWTSATIHVGVRQTSDVVLSVQDLLRAGRAADVISAATEALGQCPLPHEQVAILMAGGMAMFDAGDVIGSLESHRRALDISQHSCPELKFSSALALFSREAQFQTPDEALQSLSLARQLAASMGNAPSLASLHLVIARLESLRGHLINAHRQMEISRRISRTIEHVGLRTAIELVDSGLEVSSGNFGRASACARAGLELATPATLQVARAACLANMASICLATGKPRRAREYAQEALSHTGGLFLIRLGILDSLVHAALMDEQLAESARLLESCARTIQQHRVPARSWYDLDHQVTRCAYHEHLGDWTPILAICDDVEPEVARRQYKSIRTALLCSKARALAHLGEFGPANQAIAAAVRTCPRGAIDPQIVIEASKAVCLTRAGDATAGAVHFDRALAACHGIGHKYHEAWITRSRDRLGERARVAVSTRDVPTSNAALLLTDVSAILGAGHSIDLLAQRTASILRSTPLGHRLDLHDEASCDVQPEPTAKWDASADGAWTIELRGSDRRITLRVADVRTIDEIALVTGVADLVRAAISRTADAENDDDDQTLWPRAGLPTADDTVFRSPHMVELLKIAARLASAPLPILITGETGTGKEIVARLIHEWSQVKRGPFVPFNCAATPRDLVESQLFGHRRGAFTGAVEAFPGLIRSADGGTLFLDEIGDLDGVAQPKLLRFLESGEVQAVGDVRAQRVNARIISATNANLDDLVQQGRFRPDLFYRINGAHLALPALRERKDEIPALVSLFVARYSRECRRSGLMMADDLVAALLLYDWPGNIRELANEIRRIVALAGDGDVLSAASLAPHILKKWNDRAPVVAVPAGPSITIHLDQPLASAVDELEQRFIDHALQSSGGRVSDAAELLGVSRKGLFLKRRRRGMVPSTSQAAPRAESQG